MPKQYKNDLIDTSISSLDTSLEIYSNVDASDFNKSNYNILNPHDEPISKNFKKITVCIRKKPLPDTEDIIEVKNKSLTIKTEKLSIDLSQITSFYNFTFDTIYDKYTSTLEIFEYSIKPIINHALSSGSSSIIAYGQTNTGKTYTLLQPYTGILFESLSHILNSGKSGIISFCEVYMGKVYDCFNKKSKIELYERNGEIYFSEITTMSFKDFEDVKTIFEEGFSKRTCSSTDSNSLSSRSHAIIIIEFEHQDRPSANLKYKKVAASNSLIFVDLAGSEKGSDRKQCSKITISEGAEINKSLLSLKECIRGIDNNAGHLPFRSSKLTQLLKNSFLGNSKTCVIATIAAKECNLEPTLNTLRYMERLNRANIELENLTVSNTYNNINQSINDSHRQTENTAETAQSESSFSIYQSRSKGSIQTSDEREASNSKKIDFEFNEGYLEPNSRGRIFYNFDQEKYASFSNMPSANPFEKFVDCKPAIQPSTIILQKNKINRLLNELAIASDDESNLAKLKSIFLELDDIKKRFG